MTSARLMPPDGLPNNADMEVDEQWSVLFAEQLSSVRKTAESWRTGLVGLLGLVSIFSVIQAPAAAKDLVPWAVWVTGGCILISGVAAVGGAVHALHAAFGVPERLTRAEFHRLGGQEGLDLQQADRARGQLRVAQGMTYLALAALGTAMALAWYAPTKPTDLVKTTTTTGLVVCGSLVASGEGELQINSKTSGPTLLKFSEIMELSIVEDCDA